jgi:hypothetical protein
MLSAKNEASHLWNLLLLWTSNGSLPTEIGELEKLNKQLKD